MRKFIALAIFAGLSALASLSPAAAQSLNNATVTGKFFVVGGPPPTVTGGTLAAGSNDLQGVFTASATSGSITFAQPRNVAPNCLIVDASATPVIVYTISTTAITLTTLTSTHVYRYQCYDLTGG